MTRTQTQTLKRFDADRIGAFGLNKNARCPRQDRPDYIEKRRPPAGPYRHFLARAGRCEFAVTAFQGHGNSRLWQFSDFSCHAGRKHQE